MELFKDNSFMFHLQLVPLKLKKLVLNIF